MSDTRAYVTLLAAAKEAERQMTESIQTAPDATYIGESYSEFVDARDALRAAVAADGGGGYDI